MSIEAMKLALEALEYTADYDTSVTLQKAAIDTLRTAIEQAEKQEPACWVTPDSEGFRMRLSPPVTDVPLKWIPLYTAPPQREWVGLTDEEVIDIWAGVSTGYDDEINIVHLGKCIEAKLKEKNI